MQKSELEDFFVATDYVFRLSMRCAMFNIFYKLFLLYRREISDDAGLTSFSFGQDEVDRHVILWKKVRYEHKEPVHLVLRKCSC